MKKIRHKIKRIIAVVMAVVCMMSTVCCINVSAVNSEQVAGAIKGFSNTEFSGVIKGLVNTIPVIGPVSSDAVSDFVNSLLGIDAGNDVDSQLTEMNNSLKNIEDSVKDIQNFLVEYKDTKDFEISATAVDTVCDDYIIKIEEACKYDADKDDKTEVESYKKANLPTVVNTVCNGNEFQNEVINLGKYLLGEGTGQSKGAVNSYYDYCKTKANFGCEAKNKAENYINYAQNIYSKGVFTLVSGLLSKRDYANSKMDKEVIEKQIVKVATQFKQVDEMFKTLDKKMDSEETIFLADNVEINTDVKTCTLKKDKNTNTTGEYIEDIPFSTVQKIANTCPKK